MGLAFLQRFFTSRSLSVIAIALKNPRYGVDERYRYANRRDAVLQSKNSLV